MRWPNWFGRKQSEAAKGLEDLPRHDVDVFSKQVDAASLNAVGKVIMRRAFGSFMHAQPEDYEESRRRFEESTRVHFGDDVLPVYLPRRALHAHRFAGESLHRGNYFTLSHDLEGNDGGTLYNELLAYATKSTTVDSEGILELFDLSLPEHRRAAEELAHPKLHELLRPPRLMLFFAPTRGVHHPFVSDLYPNESGAVPVFIDVSVRKMRLRGAIDLRRPDVAEQFTKLATRLTMGSEGDIGCFPNREGLDSFGRLLPTMLDQELGGGHGKFSTVVGFELRRIGVSSLIYPSARSDSRAVVQEGLITDWAGCNLVVYDDEIRLTPNAVIDVGDAWRDDVGTSPDHMGHGDYLTLKGVTIESHAESTSGTWSVSGLAEWQEALYHLRTVQALVGARDPELWETLSDTIGFLMHRAPDADKFIRFMHLLRGSLLGDESQKERLLQAASVGAGGVGPALRSLYRVCD